MQLLGVDDVLMAICSTLIHACGIVFVSLLGFFMITFSAPQEIKTVRFWLFQTNFVVLLLACILGFVEHGAELGVHGLRAKPGPLLPYYNLSVLAYGVYFWWVCWRAYRTAQTELLRSQLQAILATAVPAFGMFLATNAVIPAMFGNYKATPAGALWYLLLFGGVAYILVHGRSLVACKILGRVVQRAPVRSEEGVEMLADLVRRTVAEYKDGHAQIQYRPLAQIPESR